MCMKSCPENAISRNTLPEGGFEYAVDANKCIGCGICTTKCKFDAIHLEKVNDTHGRGYFRTLLTVASNAPAAGRRFVRKKLQH